MAAARNALAGAGVADLVERQIGDLAQRHALDLGMIERLKPLRVIMFVR
jgi:hypothetical protein